MESRHDSGFLGHTIIYLKPGLGQGSGPGTESKKDIPILGLSLVSKS
jgi:hypothetical protein